MRAEVEGNRFPPILDREKVFKKKFYFMQEQTFNNDNVDKLFVKELQTIPLILKLYI